VPINHLQAGFKTLKLAMINSFKNKVSALTDEMLRANPALELLDSWPVSLHTCWSIQYV
jgi:hypothetical protein